MFLEEYVVLYTLYRGPDPDSGFLILMTDSRKTLKEAIEFKNDPSLMVKIKGRGVSFHCPATEVERRLDKWAEQCF